MAIEINIGKTTTTSERYVTGDNNAATTQGTVARPVLGGENLKVTSGATTDLEKLVAQLKNETSDTQMSVTQRRISVLQTVLDSMSDRITDKERESLIEIETLNGEKTEVESELYGLEADKTSTEGRISELDMKIAELEKAIEQAVEDGEEHRKQVEELKRQRSEEEEKLDQINTAIESANSKISGIDVKIAECTKTIAQTTLNEVANALKIAAGEKQSSSASTADATAESNADRVKEDKKAAAVDIGNVIRDALDKIDDQISQVLDEAKELVKA